MTDITHYACSNRTQIPRRVRGRVSSRSSIHRCHSSARQGRFEQFKSPPGNFLSQMLSLLGRLTSALGSTRKRRMGRSSLPLNRVGRAPYPPPRLPLPVTSNRDSLPEARWIPPGSSVTPCDSIQSKIERCKVTLFPFFHMSIGLRHMRHAHGAPSLVLNTGSSSHEEIDHVKNQPRQFFTEIPRGS